jgi:hypothetical protein
MTACLLQKRLRISGYVSRQLAAAAHDHAVVWQGLHAAAAAAAGAAPGGEGAAASELLPAQARAAVLAVDAELNYPAAKYGGDAALLAKLAGATRRQLQEHLQPARLARWEGPGSDTRRQAGRGGGQGGAASAAPLRRDNTTQFVGVTRISNNTKLQAGITGECGGASYPGL